MEKLTNLEHLRAASLAAKGLIGEVAGATAEALGEMAEALEELAAQQQGGIPAAGGGIPSGLVAVWSGAADAVPDGWALCDGENGTPDLRDRFVLGAGSSYEVGATGGEKTHKLTVSEMPSHSHVEYVNDGSGWNYIKSGRYPASAKIANVTGSGTRSTAYTFMGQSNDGIYDNLQEDLRTGNAGSSQAHNNMPPYYALCYIMKL